MTVVMTANEVSGSESDRQRTRIELGSGRSGIDRGRLGLMTVVMTAAQKNFRCAHEKAPEPLHSSPGASEGV
jgi:hypothetical protein